MKVGLKHHFTKAEVLNKTLEILGGGAPMWKDMEDAFNVEIRPGEVKIELSVVGRGLQERLTKKGSWSDKFGAFAVYPSSVPSLSVGPLSAEFNHADALVVGCPIYGGNELHLDWFKDGNLIYSHNVSSCKYEGKTSRMYVIAERGSSKYECRVMLWVSRPQQVDHGTFVCQVTDRRYQLSQKVVAGVNDSLLVEISPLVTTVRVGENASLVCTTKNRDWHDNEHYAGEWEVLPPDGFSEAHRSFLLRKGFQLDLFNVTKALRIRCAVREKEGLVWTPGTSLKVLAEATVPLHVLAGGRSACPPREELGVAWHLTPVNERDEAGCPSSHVGLAERWCRSLPPPSPRSPPRWDRPDFSRCLYAPLRFVRTALLLHERGYRTIPGSVDELAAAFNRILLEREVPFLPGEGGSILQILRKLQEDSWRLLRLVMRFTKSSLSSLKFGSRESQATHLTYVAAKMGSLAAGGSFAVDSGPFAGGGGASNSTGEVRVEVRLDDHSSRAWWAARERAARASGSWGKEEAAHAHAHAIVKLGVVAFLSPRTTIDRLLIGKDHKTEVPVMVEAPLVEIVAVSESFTPMSGGGDARRCRPDAADFVSTRLSFMSSGSFGSGQCEDPRWAPGCGRADPVGASVVWDLNACDLRKAGAEEGRWDARRDEAEFLGEGGCACHCKGQGIFALLLVRKARKEPSPAWDANLMTGISCVVALVVLALCLVLLLPRAAHSSTQLQLLKCLALAAVNAIFAAYALFPVAKTDYAGVMAALASSLVLCLGVGVCQQMALHQHLAIAPMHHASVSPTRICIFIVFLISTMSGTIVWTIHHIKQYPLSTPWLPLGNAWGMTALVAGFLIAVTLLWGVLVLHNMMQLATLRANTPQHKGAVLIRGLMRQLVVVAVGEWLMVTASFGHQHAFGRYFFGLSAVIQSVVMLLASVFGSHDVTALQCCSGAALADQNSPGEREDGADDMAGTEGCIGTLMACRGPSYTGVSVHNANILREDDSTEFRARGGSFWSQTTTTLALSETGEVLPSPSDLPMVRDPFGLEGRARLPLYARQGSGLHTARNLFLRGTDLLHGEDSSRRTQDTLLSASSLLAQTEGRLPVGLKRNLSYSSHQPIIHEFPLEMYQGSPKKGRDSSGRYLDMTGSKHKRNGASPADGSGRPVASRVRRSYVNVKDEPVRQPGLPTTQGHQVHPEDKKTTKSYVNITEDEEGGRESGRTGGGGGESGRTGGGEGESGRTGGGGEGEGDEQAKTKHHYLPMTVHPHRMVILHSPITPDSDVNSNKAVNIQIDDKVQINKEQQEMAGDDVDDNSSSRESLKTEEVEAANSRPDQAEPDVPQASPTPTESTDSPKSRQSFIRESPVIFQTVGHCENDLFHAPLENNSPYCNGANRTAFTCLHACGEAGNSVVFILPSPCCHEQGVHTAHQSPQNAKVSPRRKQEASPPCQKHNTLTPHRHHGVPKNPSENHATLDSHYKRSDSRGTASPAEDGEGEPENHEENQETDDLLLSLVPLDLENDDEISPDTQDCLPVLTRKPRNTAL
ncbi:uncharacterized protein LOC125036821 [Penaeus chinensis]|uniref:uncharacterized protein LOC125036821 n=1 Tax=Penaeus chinensis TaxID=139456 RepID=UPI001FB731B1|nr:uncharacterized protein LOC125036821 [Penaeus chinensis]